MRKFAPVVAAICLCACVAPAAHATEPFAKVGYGFTALQDPLGVRNIGMGATGTSDVSGLATGYFNPANVAFAKATTFFSSYEDMPFDQSLSDFQVAAPIPFHSDSTTGAWQFAASLGFTYMNYPAMTERTIFLPEGTGHYFDPDAWGLSALGATSWTHGLMQLAGGATAKYQQQELGSGNFDLFSFDLGAIAAFPLPLGDGMIRPRLGYAALNLDTGADIDRTHVIVANEYRGGFGVDFATPRVTVAEKSVPAITVSLDYDRIDREDSSPIEFSAGAELSIVDMIHLRYGAIDDVYDTYGAGVGWDFGNALFRLDYAHTSLRDDSLERFFNESLDRNTFGVILGMRW